MWLEVLRTGAGFFIEPVSVGYWHEGSNTTTVMNPSVGGRSKDDDGSLVYTSFSALTLLTYDS